MREADINRLITEQVDEIEENRRKQFIREILAFERQHMDLEQPHYRDDYRDLIEKYAPDAETNSYE